MHTPLQVPQEYLDMYPEIEDEVKKHLAGEVFCKDLLSMNVLKFKLSGPAEPHKKKETLSTHKKIYRWLRILGWYLNCFMSYIEQV